MPSNSIFDAYTTFASTLSKMMYPFIECHLIRYEESSDPTCETFFKNKKTQTKGNDNIPEMLQKNKIQEKLSSNLVNFAYINRKGKNTKSSAIGIYDKNNLVGCLTIHLETTYFENFISLMSHFVETKDNHFLIDHQRFDASKIENDVDKIIENYLLENNLVNGKIKKTNKKEIIELLIDKEYLSRKGAITKIANILSLSRPTVYRYIKEILKNSSDKKPSQNIPEALLSTLTAH